MHYCPRCGNGVTEPVRFCPKCGNSFTPVPAASSFYVSSSLAPSPVAPVSFAATIPTALGAAAVVAEKSSKRWLKRTLISLLILAIIAAAIYFSGIRKSDETLIRERIESFEKDYNNGDWDAVIQNFDAQTRNAYKAMSSLFKFSASFSITDSAKLGLSTDFASLFALGCMPRAPTSRSRSSG